MTAERVIADLRARGIVLVADGTHLRCRPRSALTECDLATLREIKPAVLARLREEHATTPAKIVCYACRTSSFWRSIHGPLVCGVCHPPASPELVDKWIESSTRARRC